MMVSLIDDQHTTMTWAPSPQDVSKDIQDQFQFLLSLSKEEEYVQLVKQAADVNVCPISLSYFAMIYCVSQFRNILMP
jgi:hypothetical protein